MARLASPTTHPRHAPFSPCCSSCVHSFITLRRIQRAKDNSSLVTPHQKRVQPRAVHVLGMRPARRRVQTAAAAARARARATQRPRTKAHPSPQTARLALPPAGGGRTRRGAVGTWARNRVCECVKKGGGGRGCGRGRARAHGQDRAPPRCARRAAPEAQASASARKAAHSLEQCQNVAVAHRAAHIPHNRAVLVVQKLDAHLRHVARAAGAAENPARREVEGGRGAVVRTRGPRGDGDDHPSRLYRGRRRRRRRRCCRGPAALVMPL